MEQSTDTFTTEQQIRQFTHTSTTEGVYSAPQPMDLTEVAHLIFAIVNDPHSEFLNDCLIYEPIDILSNPGSRDIGITQAISIRDTVAGQFEDAREQLEKQNAQTKRFVEGEVGPPIYREEE